MITEWLAASTAHTSTRHILKGASSSDHCQKTKRTRLMKVRLEPKWLRTPPAASNLSGVFWADVRPYVVAPLSQADRYGSSFCAISPEVTPHTNHDAISRCKKIRPVCLPVCSGLSCTTGLYQRHRPTCPMHFVTGAQPPASSIRLPLCRARASCCDDFRPRTLSIKNPGTYREVVFNDFKDG